MATRWLTVWVLITLGTPLVVATAGEDLSLAGTWRFRLDPENVGLQQGWFHEALPDTIRLPGSTDEGGYGAPEVAPVRYNALVRRHYYVGRAWYQRDVEIPADWARRRIVLFLERCHWLSEVWVDDHPAGREDSLCTPHTYDLTRWLTPGRHRLTICVNNRYPFSLGGFASSVSEHTQTNWNGIVGRIELRARDRVWIDDARVYPDVAHGQARVRLTIGNGSGRPVAGAVEARASLENGPVAGRQQGTFRIEDTRGRVALTVPMGEDVRLWDEFSPTLYRMDVRLTAGPCRDERTLLFGMREFGVAGTRFTVNGKPIYLRGTLECCVFPLTGYPAMTEAAWIRILRTMRDYGLNHVRFHSWCPPEAAFAAASRVGMYLQAEGPRANVDNRIPERDAFIANELLRINRYYGNQPSFMLMTSGNELKSKTDINPAMVARAKADDDRHLYSTTSGGYGMEHNEHAVHVDQFRVGAIRGIFGPSTDRDHGERLRRYPVPYVSHEVGQWAVFPNVAEIPRYTGVLRPQNLEEIRADLAAKGLREQAADFVAVTARQSALLYKEEIEALLRSPGHAGFQLLSLHDYPGQGTAHVGLVNAFWQSKGGIAPADFRAFCGPTVPLLRLPKRTYTAAETFRAGAEILHYGPQDLTGVRPVWSLETVAGEVVAQGRFPAVTLARGDRAELGAIEVGLDGVTRPAKLTVSLAVPETEARNRWEIWCYPAAETPAFPTDVVVSDRFDARVREALAAGAKVLLLPREATLAESLPGRFKPVFWSPTWFWTRPRGGDVTMSILCDPTHPVFALFPTERYSNWQWWDLQEHSRAIVLDALAPACRPLVQVVDNFGRMHRLGLLLEARVEAGRLMICSIDIERDLDRRPAARQFRASLVHYLASPDFRPQARLAAETVRALFAD